MDNDTKARLHRQLVKLGDMMGDGLHHEPDGKWISKEYKRVMTQLGLMPKVNRRNSNKANNAAMLERLKSVDCPKCDGRLKQTRSGSLRAKCLECEALYQIFKRKRRVSNV